MLAGFGAIIAGFGVLGVVASLEHVPAALASPLWPTVTGEIIEVDARRQSRTTNFGVRYRYTIDGRAYEGDRIWYSRVGRQSASTLNERYDEGDAVEVYYDPDDPARAILQPGATTWSIVRDSFAVGLVLVAGLAVTTFGLAHAVRG